MLTTLRISGFAVVDKAEIRFGPGLTVLTGETGAGKSILIEALHLVLGGRLRADVLRDGAEEAVVEALFELTPDHPVLRRVEAVGLAPDPGSTELLVRRVVSRSGRGRVFVNGALATVGLLESALRGLLDVTGQHEHVALLDEGSHLAALDAFGGLDREGGPLTRYREPYRSLAAALRERQALLAERDERARRADYLAFQLAELDAARARPGEDGELERERHVLASIEKLRDAARGADALVYGEDGSAAERLGRAVRALGDASEVDPRLEGPLSLLRSALVEVEEAGRALERYAEVAGGDPERLAAVEERLAALTALARKHGGTLEVALARGQAMRDELATVSGSDERLAALEREVGELGPRTLAAAEELTRARAEAARAFSREVERQLQAVAMRCRVEVALAPAPEAIRHEGASLGPDGAERASILIAPNPGEPPRALARIASGGELSRVLLAVKRALARADPVDTYVFDEVDAGIGGGVAEAVGRLLGAVARDRQVLCVTHLPQVAAFADAHLKVEKRVHGGRTSTVVTPLAEPGERQAEVARMLAGLTVTPSALAHAGALLQAARDGAAPAPARRAHALRRAASR